MVEENEKLRREDKENRLKNLKQVNALQLMARTLQGQALAQQEAADQRLSGFYDVSVYKMSELVTQRPGSQLQVPILCSHIFDTKF
eukprot:g27310.t1